MNLRLNPSPITEYIHKVDLNLERYNANALF